MDKFKFIPIPSEDYDALGIKPNSVLETRVTKDGSLIIRIVSDEDLDGLVCDSDCEGCPMIAVNSKNE